MYIAMLSVLPLFVHIETISIQVKFAVFWTYAKNIGVLMALLIVLFYVSANACSVGSNFWLSAWSDDMPVNGTYEAKQRNIRLGVYALLGFSQGSSLLLCPNGTSCVSCLALLSGSLHAI